MKKLLGTIVLGLLSMSVLSDQTGNCTAGEQYCEQNSLTTTNSTTLLTQIQILIQILILTQILTQLIV